MNPAEPRQSRDAHKLLGKAILSQSLGRGCAGSIDQETLRRWWAGSGPERQKAFTLAKAQSSQRKVKILRACFLDDWRLAGNSVRWHHTLSESRTASHAFDFDFPLPALRLCEI